MKVRQIPYLALGLALLILGSYLSFYLPFTQIPFTLQVFFLFLITLYFSPVETFFIVFAYLLLGGIGLPVFAGGKGGLNALFGPTGGYLFGFLIGGIIISMVKKYSEILALFLGILIIYLTGSIWLSNSLKISYYKALITGVLPFIPYDFAKALISYLIWQRLKKQLKTNKS
ncbi:MULTISPECIES: biotin transporter BioY [Dictyoglomus]|jgi:biotin transport system substrate-specific component|uniref:Biotin transporter n=1 Tax=Dictyoglomus turgidum (strain DSM 6724 / Z-1310) TaxID=515635 RepID=B8DZL1_DICTD|nr:MULTISPECIES: biotin transporter BioY [Dictyoglomus]ACK41944.1 BioY protein [Dictyoglomus turgidum DSM 6724]PNV79231.1 MAG: biotin transporter BioY [Dictyoglomus turgidum]HBU31496.1 biotin transporter BioY [Dictyoglomus sp.]